jgi:hypothetical protein
MLTFSCDPVKLQNEEYLKAIANGQEIVLTDDEGEDDEGDEGLEDLGEEDDRLAAGDKVGDDDSSSSSDEEEDGSSSSSSSSESESSSDDEEEEEPVKVGVKASDVAKTAKKVAGTAVKTAKKYATKENLEKAKKVANVAVKTAKKYATKENLEKAKKVAKSAGQVLGVKASISSAQQSSSSSGSDLIGASVPSALSEDEAAAQFTRLVNITPDSERRDFGIVKMPVHFDFTASVDELGDNVNKDVSAIDRKVITLIGRRVA